ncbi:LOW QUALITY PROTEIN: unconventional myosin-IXa-like [Lingula anatina]|uniref:LOW QUALITY PROTEIN: unconventional myosin-IXa-like n=1 Tax=Lingula anatina TaxID=7574 RepID=A0A1S3K725_LINAN|nr:LOW QUALITY PROTEIN: unconventional myosin-IXa-like [Lingula anatina]|eukprot:XP_013418061.1 LOW QUALITY PROTEIN: unconventional myosin-IXa-like [Lingula anatina]
MDLMYPRRPVASPPDTLQGRRLSLETFMVRVHMGPLSQETEFTSVEAEKTTQALEVVRIAVAKLALGKAEHFELAEVFVSGGQLCKERRLLPNETPVRIQLLWPRPMAAADILPSTLDPPSQVTEYRFYLRKKGDRTSSRTGSWVEYAEPNPVDTFLSSFLKQRSGKDYPDLCNLPDLNEVTLMENLKLRFSNGNIYTYVGSILIAVNPFKFFPIYNPKYVNMYQNRRLGDLPPHIFAIADAAYHTMLHEKSDQCIVISGESGSGKTESTNLLLHHLTALSQKGLHGSGVEQTILGAGPVLEAFGNAKTVHNNNSSRFGKFIEVNYKENGMVHGAVVEQYLLEKSRIVSQAHNERNYHVFYYLLAGATEHEKESLCLSDPDDFHYLRQSQCHTLEGVDEAHEFARLKQSMEIVGFSTETQRRVFSVLSAVLHLGNIEFKKKSEIHHDEAVYIKNIESVQVISGLLKVKEETLVEALTMKKTTAGEETVIIPYRMEDALATRDAMAKCLYGALFDWIVLQVNHSLLAKKDHKEHQVYLYGALFDWIVLQVNHSLLAKKDHKEHQGNSIGVLDIFGFEDFTKNSFEQFCINYANEHLQYYFNQHIFKFEQEEYQREGIQWKNIEFIDNTGCLDLFAKKPHGLFHLLDEECNFPGATNETLLTKFHTAHKGNPYYEAPQLRESSFTIQHYAGKVKYQTQDFREKNCDLMRPDIVSVLKNSSLGFVRELVGGDPVAVLNWAILRAFFRSFFAFISAGKRYRKAGGTKLGVLRRQKSAGQFVKLARSGSDSALRDVFHVALAFSAIRRINLPRSSLIASQTLDPAVGQLHERLGGLDLPSMEEKIEEVVEEDQQRARHSYIYTNNSKAMRKAARVLMKNKSFKPKVKTTKGFRDLKSMKTVAGRSMLSSRGGSKKQPPSVSAQFQISLSQLMATLSQANPFFIRCIKSNSNKAPCEFDDDIILRQLRYTGMLATVMIRQSGYNYRLTFEEFIQHYKLLLPRGLCSSKTDVICFLETLDINHENYQIGKTKVFLREAEKILLDDALHQALMQRIVRIQRWMRTILKRKAFLRLREATLRIQAQFRCYIAQRQLQAQLFAVRDIQKWYRMARERRKYLHLKQRTIHLQAKCRGYLVRKTLQGLREEKRRQAERALQRHHLGQHHEHDQHSSTSDEGILSAKGSSNEELDKEFDQADQGQESEGSSGYPEDSEPESTGEVHSVPSTPTSPTAIPFDPGALGRKAISPGSRIRRVKPAYQEQTKDNQASPTTSGWPLSKSSSADSIAGLTRLPAITISREKRASAPLAKQESITDQLDVDEEEETFTSVESQHTPLSPTALSDIEKVLEKKLEEGDTLSSEHKSPLKKAKHKIFNIMGAVRESTDSVMSYSRRTQFKIVRHYKTQVQSFSHYNLCKKSHKKEDDSDLSEPEDTSGSRRSAHPSVLGVHVLPTNRPSGQLSAPSPKSSPKLGVKTKKAWSSNESSELPEHSEEGKIKKKRNSKRRKREKEKENKEKGGSGKWNVSGTSAWQYPPDLTVNSVEELQRMSKFMFNKIAELNKDCGRRDTVLDKVFKDSLSEFHRNLISILSVKMQEDKTSVKYKELMSNFRQILINGAKQEGQDENMFPATIFINAFRGFLDEFQKERPKMKVEEKWEVKPWRKKRKEKDPVFIAELNKDCGRRDTVLDKVFKDSLSEFHRNLISILSVKMQEDKTSVKYKELMSNFRQILINGAKQEGQDENMFPATIFINAFRGFLDEFQKERPKMKVEEKWEVKPWRKKRKEKDPVFEYLGHKFTTVQFNIPTFCEVCGRMMWMMEKGTYCQICKFTCHKKCGVKYRTPCKGQHGDRSIEEEVSGIFGVQLCHLLQRGVKVPPVIERLITAIEMKGLYTEGVYRKSGAAVKTKQLVKAINADPDGIDFDNYQIHVLTYGLKQFLRELPEPLLTFELYDDFLQATDSHDDKDCTQALYAVIERLPKHNFDLFERLIFHLARVAFHEESNKMSVNSLAIIFAPCVLKTNKQMPAQESLSHVPKQTQ